MRVRVLTLGLALVIGGSSLGCKSTPKMPWFKSADKSVPGATTATLAQGAPQLPSEIAKQAEGISSTDPVRITTAPAVATTAATTAPPYSATSTPSAYPTTGAQDYLSNSSALKSATSASAGLPYDPTAVPAVSTAVAANASTNSAMPAQVDRYGLAATDRYADAYTETTPAYPPVSYPTTSTPTAALAQANVAASSVAPFASNPDSLSLGDRYATQTAPMTSAPVSSASYTPVQTASALASVQPYRPGGTATYPGTSANYEVATRPSSNNSVGGYETTSGTQYR